MRIIFTPFILSNLLSEVTTCSCRNFAVAAIIASGVFSIWFCLNSIAMFFISGVRPVITQSFKRDFNNVFFKGLSLGQPKSSISVIIETYTEVFTQRFLLPHYGNKRKSLLHFFFCNRFFNFYNHIPMFKKLYSLSKFILK